MFLEKEAIVDDDLEKSTMESPMAPEAITEDSSSPRTFKWPPYDFIKKDPKNEPGGSGAEGSSSGSKTPEVEKSSPRKRQWPPYKFLKKEKKMSPRSNQKKDDGYKNLPETGDEVWEQFPGQKGAKGDGAGEVIRGDQYPEAQNPKSRSCRPILITILILIAVPALIFYFTRDPESEAGEPEKRGIKDRLTGKTPEDKSNDEGSDSIQGNWLNRKTGLSNTHLGIAGAVTAAAVAGGTYYALKDKKNALSTLTGGLLGKEEEKPSKLGGLSMPLVGGGVAAAGLLGFAGYKWYQSRKNKQNGSSNCTNPSPHRRRRNDSVERLHREEARAAGRGRGAGASQPDDPSERRDNPPEDIPQENGKAAVQKRIEEDTMIRDMIEGVIKQLGVKGDVVIGHVPDDKVLDKMQEVGLGDCAEQAKTFMFRRRVGKHVSGMYRSHLRYNESRPILAEDTASVKTEIKDGCNGTGGLRSKYPNGFDQAEADRLIEKALDEWRTTVKVVRDYEITEDMVQSVDDVGREAIKNGIYTELQRRITTKHGNMICYDGAVRVYAWNEVCVKKLEELISKRNKALGEEFEQQCDDMWESLQPKLDQIIASVLVDGWVAWGLAEVQLENVLDTPGLTSELKTRCKDYTREQLEAIEGAAAPKRRDGGTDGVDSSSSAPPGRPKSWAGLDSNFRQRIRDLVDGNLGFGSQGGPRSNNVEKLLKLIAAKLKKIEPEPERGDLSRRRDYARHLINNKLGSDA